MGCQESVMSEWLSPHLHVVSTLKNTLCTAPPHSHLCRSKLITVSMQTIIFLVYSETKGEIGLHNRSGADNWQQTLVAAMTINFPLHAVLSDCTATLSNRNEPNPLQQKNLYEVFCLDKQGKILGISKATSKYWLWCPNISKVQWTSFLLFSRETEIHQNDDLPVEIYAFI